MNVIVTCSVVSDALLAAVAVVHDPFPLAPDGTAANIPAFIAPVGNWNP